MYIITCSAQEVYSRICIIRICTTHIHDVLGFVIFCCMAHLSYCVYIIFLLYAHTYIIYIYYLPRLCTLLIIALLDKLTRLYLRICLYVGRLVSIYSLQRALIALYLSSSIGSSMSSTV